MTYRKMLKAVDAMRDYLGDRESDPNALVTQIQILPDKIQQYFFEFALTYIQATGERHSSDVGSEMRNYWQIAKRVNKALNTRD
jgi:hypothetical protein